MVQGEFNDTLKIKSKYNIYHNNTNICVWYKFWGMWLETLESEQESWDAFFPERKRIYKPFHFRKSPRFTLLKLSPVPAACFPEVIPLESAISAHVCKSHIRKDLDCSISERNKYRSRSSCLKLRLYLDINHLMYVTSTWVSKLFFKAECFLRACFPLPPSLWL